MNDKVRGETVLTVSFIDKAHRAIYMEYNECSITINFSKQRNTGIKDSLKEILIASMMDRTEG